MILSEIARMRVEERIREGAEARRGLRAARGRRRGHRVRRAVGLGLVRAGNAVLAGPKMRVA